MQKQHNPPPTNFWSHYNYNELKLSQKYIFLHISNLCFIVFPVYYNNCYYYQQIIQINIAINNII